MYTPRHFSMTDEQVRDPLATAETAQLVTAHPSGPVATLLPVLHRPDEGLGSLIFHVTRTNSQWRDTGLGDALAILSGPDGYINPDWYASQAVKHSVPTWNYVTVHAYGKLVVHDDPAWTRAAVLALGDKHGYVAGLTEEEWDRQLRPIVGLELRIARIEAKAKLSQNRTPEDIAGAIAGLHAVGDEALASTMEEISLPHAEARYRLMAEVRDGRRLGEVDARRMG